MIGPTLLLWLYAVAFALAWIVAGGRGVFSIGADLISRLAMAMVVTIWVVRDAQKRGRRLCYDYEMFLFFGWPVVAPVYLFQTRGMRAFLTFLCFMGIWLLVALSIGVATAVQEASSP